MSANRGGRWDVEVAGADRAEITHRHRATYLAALQSDLVVARAYQVEIDSLGPAARQLASDALDERPEPDLVALGDEIETRVSDVFRDR